MVFELMKLDQKFKANQMFFRFFFNGEILVMSYGLTILGKYAGGFAVHMTLSVKICRATGCLESSWKIVRHKAEPIICVGVFNCVIIEARIYIHTLGLKRLRVQASPFYYSFSVEFWFETLTWREIRNLESKPMYIWCEQTQLNKERIQPSTTLV